MLNQAIYIRLLILFCAFSTVQRIKLFKINVKVCRPIIATSKGPFIIYTLGGGGQNGGGVM